MRAGRSAATMRVDGGLKIAAMSTAEQVKRIRAAIARRAYEIFESRGSLPWHELEDWRRAESEVVSSLFCGLTTCGDSICVGADAGSFEEGTIEIWVAPRYLTICGKPRAEKIAIAPKESPPDAQEEFVFRVLDLPAEIDPRAVSVRSRGQSLEITLPRAHPAPERELEAAAA